MKIEDLKQKKIYWGMTPQSYAVGIDGVSFSTQKELELIYERIRERAGCYFYIDVCNFQPRLCLMENTETGEGRAEIVDIPGISEDDLIEAVEEAGGAINISGHYPISEKIKRILKKKLTEKAKSE